MNDDFSVGLSKIDFVDCLRVHTDFSREACEYMVKIHEANSIPLTVERMRLMGFYYRENPMHEFLDDLLRCRPEADQYKMLPWAKKQLYSALSEANKAKINMRLQNLGVEYTILTNTVLYRNFHARQGEYEEVRINDR
jgi:hypothetical protein